MAHPHIGTFKLVKVVEALREHITELGGEVRFEQRVTGVLLEPDAKATRQNALPRNACVGGAQTWPAARPYELAAQPGRAGAWATARATPSRCCTDAGVYLEAKPFSIGVALSTRKA